MTSSPGDLAIFDCDGVLVDSERLANTVFAELISAVGLPTTFEECVATYMGRSLPSCIEIIEARLGRPVPADFAEQYYARVFAVFDRELEAVPGVVAALDAVEALGLTTCVASSGPHERLRRTLGRTGLLARFEGRIFSAADVARGKPFPDLFLHAAEGMGVAAARCVVVEDSPAGVHAGCAAGMRVLGYSDLVAPRLLADEGARVFFAMSDLPGLVGAALRRSAPD